MGTWPFTSQGEWSQGSQAHQSEPGFFHSPDVREEISVVKVTQYVIVFWGFSGAHILSIYLLVIF